MTTYVNTFIRVSPDATTTTGRVPQKSGTIADLEYALIAPHPYCYTHGEVQFLVHAQRHQLTSDLDQHRRAFFAKPRACLRASPLPKTHGWGFHFDHHGRVALVAIDSPDYQRLSNDPAITQTQAMRTARSR